MKCRYFWLILACSVYLLISPDLFGPIDDLLAVMTIVVDIIGFISTRGKEAKDALAALASDSTTQSR